MKAIHYPKYGPPDVCAVAEVPTPTPAPDELLIRVHQTPLTRADMAFRSGSPFISRFFTGLRRPKHVPGGEVVGVVEAVGDDATRVALGDRVIAAAGSSFGAHAEYLCLTEDGIVVKLPEDVADAHVAGLCDGGLTALQFLRDKAELQAGEEVLINGASGAVGSYAVQLADYYGAAVTGVCSTDNLELVESLGAERTIDYTKTDFTEHGDRYDVIFDAVGKRSFSQCKPALTDGGRYLTTVPSLDIVVRMVTTRFGDKQAIFAATGLSQTRDDLVLLVDLIEAGEIESVVDRRYGLEDIADAHRYVESGHKTGNVVLSVLVEE